MVIALLDRASIDSVVNLGARLGRIAHAICRRERRISMEGLALAFGDSLSLPERRSLVERMFENAGRSVAEVATLHRWREQDFRTRVDSTAMERLNHLHPGRGTIFVTAHLGCWELLAACSAIVLDRPISVVARPTENQGLEMLLARQREAVGVPVVHRGKSGRGVIRFLEQGGVLGILADQDTKHGHGIVVEYFGHPARTPLGPYQLAARSRAVTVAGFIVREPDGRRHRIVMSDPIELQERRESGEAREREAYDFTQAFTNEIEKVVRAHPDQWMWMNRRWRRGRLAALEGWKPPQEG